MLKYTASDQVSSPARAATNTVTTAKACHPESDDISTSPDRIQGAESERSETGGGNKALESMNVEKKMIRKHTGTKNGGLKEGTGMKRKNVGYKIWMTFGTGKTINEAKCERFRFCFH